MHDVCAYDIAGMLQLPGMSMTVILLSLEQPACSQDAIASLHLSTARLQELWQAVVVADQAACRHSADPILPHYHNSMRFERKIHTGAPWCQA